MRRSSIEANDPSARQRIVAEERQHFFAHGFRGVTMDDLAEELGMSKKTLYAHFRSKADLVKAVLFEKFQGLDAELKQIAAKHAADFQHALQHLLATLQRHADEIKSPFVRDIRREAP